MKIIPPDNWDEWLRRVSPEEKARINSEILRKIEVLKADMAMMYKKWIEGMSKVYEDRVEEIIEATYDYVTKGHYSTGRDVLHGIDAARGILDLIEQHKKTGVKWYVDTEDEAISE